MAQQSAGRGWDNQGFPLCFDHALGDLDPDPGNAAPTERRPSAPVFAV
jgi:hypothetical protein